MRDSTQSAERKSGTSAEALKRYVTGEPETPLKLKGLVFDKKEKDLGDDKDKDKDKDEQNDIVFYFYFYLFLFFFIFYFGGQAEKEFKVGVKAIGRVQHKNLLRLLGYYAEGAHRL